MCSDSAQLIFLEPVGHGESADMPKSEIHYEMGELEAFGQTHTQRLGNYNIDVKSKPILLPIFNENPC